MTDEIFDPKEVQEHLNISLEEIEKILKEFEDLGVVWKRWDVKKNDYVWYRTELGHKVAKSMGIE